MTFLLTIPFRSAHTWNSRASSDWPITATSCDTRARMSSVSLRPATMDPDRLTTQATQHTPDAPARAFPTGAALASFGVVSLPERRSRAFAPSPPWGLPSGATPRVSPKSPTSLTSRCRSSFEEIQDRSRRERGGRKECLPGRERGRKVMSRL